MRMNSYVIAVDGGGTKCKATMYDCDGNALVSSVSGPANMFSDSQQACNSILQASASCIAQFNANLSEKSGFKNTPLELSDVFLSAGCAGANIEGAMKAFEDWQSPFCGKVLTSDLHISCMAAGDGKDCALAILGTGSSFAVLQNRECKQFGGHGFILGDEASGAYLGKRALQICLADFDGIAKRYFGKQSLVDLANFVSNITNIAGASTSAEMVQAYAKASPIIFAKIAPQVFVLANQGNKIALQLIDEACLYICDMFESIVEKHFLRRPKSFFIAGGLSESYLPYLKEKQGLTFSVSTINAEYGAYLFALEHLKGNN